MNKIGFVIYAPSQLNSFVKSGVIRQLSENLSLSVFVSNNNLFNEIKSLGVPNCQQIRIPLICRKISGYSQMVALWRFRERSMNHLVRAMASFGTKSQRKRWRCVVVSEMKVSAPKRLLVRVMSNSIPFTFLRFIEKVFLKYFFVTKVRKTLETIDALCIPFSGHIGADFNALVFAAKKKNVTVFALQENWDNLSTKTFITEEPDVFFVWGQQSRGHLRNVHRLFKVNPFIVGSPRFQPYYQDSMPAPIVSESNGSQVKLKGFNYILIAGTGDGIDDEMLVRTVHEVILEDISIQDDMKIVYRPHPASRTKLDLTGMRRDLKRLAIDDGPLSRNFGHHNSLVAHASLVINHFSTLTIESVISGTPVVIPLFLGRPEAQYRYEHILNEWHHMMGVGLIPEISTPRDIAEFREKLRTLLDGKTRESTPSNIDWICRKADYSYEIQQAIFETLQIK